MRVAQYFKQFLVPSNLIQMVLAALVAWYAIETRTLRATSERQLEWLQYQMEVQHMPALDIIFTDAPPPSDLYIPEGAVSREIRSSPSGRKWTPVLRSHNNQTTHSITAIFFDKVTQSYTWTGAVIPVLKGKGEIQLRTTGRPTTAERIGSWLVRDSKACPNCVFDCLNDTRDSFVVVFYYIGTGSMYYLKQPYKFANDDIVKLPHSWRDLSHEPNTDLQIAPKQ